MDKQVEQDDFAARREVLKRLGMLSGAVAALVFPVVLSGCPITWENQDSPDFIKKGQRPKPE